MPDDLTPEKTPEQLAAEAAERKRQENLELAKAISDGVATSLAQREAARAQNQPVVNQEPAIDTVDAAALVRALRSEGGDAEELVRRFGTGLVEQARREARAEAGITSSTQHELVLSQARRDIEHFGEFEKEILETAARVPEAKRTLKIYQDATAMVLGRPEARKKLVQAELDKVLSKPKESAGAAESGVSSRAIKPPGAPAQENGELSATEENLRLLCGDDAFAAFKEKQRQRGTTLDIEAKQQGYADAKAWFKRMQENDRRTEEEGSGVDVNWVRDSKGQWVRDDPWVTGVSR